MSTPLKIALINMPFSSLYRPSIGLSLLKAALEKEGNQIDIHYLNLAFGVRIGVKLYDDISNGPQEAAFGEWVFTEAMFGPDPDRDAGYFADVVPAFRERGFGQDVELAAPEIRGHAAEFVEECLSAADWSAYDIIGFTSTFQQNLASLALAKRLKDRYPDKLILMGGHNTEGLMGLGVLRAFPFIDGVCSGEGDIAFPEFVRRLRQGENLSGVAGMTLQDDLLLLGQVSGAPVHDMDALPYPNFDEFFEQYERHGLNQLGLNAPNVLFESSRGCWWGAKSHCTFCGLNGTTMAFRSKSAKRALDELLYLFDRYGSYTQYISAVDNIIDMQYFQDFLPALKELGLQLSMFYETKANLRRDQVQLFADAGFHAVQPGIESLSTPILRLMKKGVTALQNVQVLKWCREYNLSAFWNYLYGFPGEDAQEYRKVLDILPLISHLQPPYGIGSIRLDRFSPYFNQPSDYGIVNVRPHRAYLYVYPGLPHELLFHLAYYFEFDYADGCDHESYVEPLRSALKDWKEQGSSEMFYLDAQDQLVLFDLRPAAVRFTHVLQGAMRLLYIHCDSIRSLTKAHSYLQESGHAITESQLAEMVEELVAARLMLREGDSILSLAIPLGRYSPGIEGAKRFLEFLRQSGTESDAAVKVEASAPAVSQF